MFAVVFAVLFVVSMVASVSLVDVANIWQCHYVVPHYFMSPDFAAVCGQSVVSPIVLVPFLLFFFSALLYVFGYIAELEQGRKDSEWRHVGLRIGALLAEVDMEGAAIRAWDAYDADSMIIIGRCPVDDSTTKMSRWLDLIDYNAADEIDAKYAVEEWYWLNNADWNDESGCPEASPVYVPAADLDVPYLMSAAA